MHESHESDDSHSWWFTGYTRSVGMVSSFASNVLPLRQRTNHVEQHRSRYNDKDNDDSWSRVCLWWKLIKTSLPIHPFDSTLGKTHCRAKRTCTIVTWKETGRRWVPILSSNTKHWMMNTTFAPVTSSWVQQLKGFLSYIPSGAGLCPCKNISIYHAHLFFCSFPIFMHFLIHYYMFLIEQFIRQSSLSQKCLCNKNGGIAIAAL